MKRIKSNKIDKVKNEKEVAENFDKINGVQVTGHVRIKRPNEKGVNKYTLKDGTEVYEDDKGKESNEKTFKKRHKRKKIEE